METQIGCTLRQTSYPVARPGDKALVDRLWECPTNSLGEPCLTLRTRMMLALYPSAPQGPLHLVQGHWLNLLDWLASVDSWPRVEAATAVSDKKRDTGMVPATQLERQCEFNFSHTNLVLVFLLQRPTLLPSVPRRWLWTPVNILLGQGWVATSLSAIRFAGTEPYPAWLAELLESNGCQPTPLALICHSEGFYHPEDNRRLYSWNLDRYTARYCYGALMAYFFLKAHVGIGIRDLVIDYVLGDLHPMDKGKLWRKAAIATDMPTPKLEVVGSQVSGKVVDKLRLVEMVMTDSPVCEACNRSGARIPCPGCGTVLFCNETCLGYCDAAFMEMHNCTTRQLLDLRQRGVPDKPTDQPEKQTPCSQCDAFLPESELSLISFSRPIGWTGPDTALVCSTACQEALARALYSLERASRARRRTSHPLKDVPAFTGD